MAPRPNLPCEPRRTTGHGPASRLYYKGGGHLRQGGAFAIMTVPLLLVIIVFCGLALDTGALYNRKVELSGLARAVALAAAKELNGTSAGVIAAQTRARQTAELFT